MSKNTQTDFFLKQPSRFVKKGEVLVRSGFTSEESFYVVKGCLRSFVVDEKGKEHIYQFAPEDWLISDLEFFRNKNVAFLTIDAVEDSEIKVVSMTLFRDLSMADNELMREGFTKMQKRIHALQRRIIQLLSYTAEQRYQDFISTYPNLHQRVPLKMIASYLGVTPESLSRVRKEMVKGK